MEYKQGSPSHIVYMFYQWYLKADVNAVLDDNIYMYVSERTVDTHRAYYEKGAVDSDYFTDSQDPDPEWLKTMVVQDERKISESTYMVTVKFQPASQNGHTLIVFVDSEPQGLRITKIENVRGNL